MKTIITGLISLFFLSCTARNFDYIIDLHGYWNFSIGDNKEWALEDYDDSNWDRIHVPSSWEQEGYREYNGYAWYRKKCVIHHDLSEGPLYLTFGRIDDVDEVFFNGVRIGGYGKFPPNFETAYNVHRIYRIPDNLIKQDAENTIAVRVYDTYLEGGIIDGKAGICQNRDNNYLNLDLSGFWKFNPGNETEWKDPKFNDSHWTSIDVPGFWEGQGFQDLDGYAWYRYTFRLPDNFDHEDIYLTLGKIDDIDQVYLNGELIGTVYDLKTNDDRHFKENYCNARRGYYIPIDLLNKEGDNVIAIKVYDSGGLGGIFIGPVGLMNQRNFNRYVKTYRNSGDMFRTIIDILDQ